jgi:3-methylfumaryl-CoA hydratase
VKTVDINALQQWVGKTQTCSEVISEPPVAALSAALDYSHPRAAHGEKLPNCWHWLYFQRPAAASDLSVDGHPKKGDFMPPVPLPRRMWAGSRLQFPSDLRLGREVRRVSTISSIAHKQGRSGELVFVTVNHQLFCEGILALEEEQDLVYREAGPSGVVTAPKSAPAIAQWEREILPDTVLLFRYSALTFNSHRIHYDRDYAVKAEGYPSLVVQGPLVATLLLDLLYREEPGVQVSAFEFRAVRPVLQGNPLRLQGRRDDREVSLWALDAAGQLSMEARATL